jgi:hypothetical protein
MLSDVQLSLKAKIIAGILLVDALLGFTSSMAGARWLGGWIFVNAIVLLPGLYIRHRLQARKKRQNRTAEDGIKSKYRLPRTETQRYGSGQITLRGEVVKSYGEKALADYFFRNNIDYEYETKVMERQRRRVRSGKEYSTARPIGRPDFYLPDFDVFVEYWGLADSYDPVMREEYTKSMNWKMDRYRENGIKFISIYKDNLEDLDSSFKSKLREATGINLSSKRRV